MQFHFSKAIFDKKQIQMLLDKVFEKYADRIPEAPKPGGVYKPVLVVDKMVYVSGHGPYLPEGGLIKGRVGDEVDQEFARDSALQTGLAILATLKQNFGSLENIQQVVKLLGMVNCTASFHAHPYVINGCSELFAEVWGPDKGLGARSAVGFVVLPNNITTEIECQFLLK